MMSLQAQAHRPHAGKQSAGSGIPRTQSPTVSAFKRQHVQRMKAANAKLEEAQRKRGSVGSSAGAARKQAVVTSRVKLDRLVSGA